MSMVIHVRSNNMSSKPYVITFQKIKKFSHTHTLHNVKLIIDQIYIQFRIFNYFVYIYIDPFLDQI